MFDRALNTSLDELTTIRHVEMSVTPETVKEHTEKRDRKNQEWW